MKKKIVSVMLAAAMTLSLAACGSASSSSSDSKDSSSDSADTASATEDNSSLSEDWSKYDELIDQIRKETDFSKRVDEMHEAEDILMSSWAVVPIYYYNDVYMAKEDLTGAYNTVYGIKYFQGAEKAGSDNININIASEPDHVDPALNSAVDGAILISNLFSGLYKYDENSEVIPEIADGMPEVSDDGTEYTVHLQKTNWSDGTPLTANDFIYSWNRVIDEKTAADYNYLFDIVARNDDGTLKVEAPDDYTLKITLTNPCPYFNSLLAFPVFYPVPQDEVEAKDTTTPGTWALEAGFKTNGAYTMTEWKHNESMTFTKNPNYFKADEVKSNTLTFMLSADSTAAYAAYNNGDLDFIDDVPTDEIANVKDSKEFHVDDQLGTYYVCFNVNSDLFKDMDWATACKFRHAISDLIDRQYIVDTVGQTGQQVADSFVPAGMSDGNGGEFKGDDSSYYDATAVNQDEAKALLEECGYTFTDNGDGTYTPDKDITIEYLINDNPGHQAVAECIQNDLSQLGINVTISTEDWNVFLNDRKEGKFSMAREGWIADYNDPINMLEIFASDSGNNDAQLGK